MVERLNVKFPVTQEILDANPDLVAEGVVVGQELERPETDQEVAARDPEAKLVKDNVTQEMLENDESFTQRGLALGDEFERLATDEELAKDASEAQQAQDKAAEGGDAAASTDANADKTGGEVNGARHPLA